MRYALRSRGPPPAAVDTYNAAPTLVNPGIPSILALPPELRNKIYRFILVSGNEIRLAGDARSQPAILRVNRQIRQEAISIYYSENEFRINIIDLNGNAMIPFRRLMLRYRSRNRCGNFRLLAKQSTNWSNLKIWLRAFYDNCGLACGKISGKSANGRTIAAAFRMVLFARERRSWKEVEHSLEAFHDAVAAQNPAWA